MKRLLLLGLLAACLSVATFAHSAAALPVASQPLPQAQPQKASTVASVADMEISIVEQEFVSAAEAMPEDKYAFAPANGNFKGVRTFAEEVKHAAAANYRIWSAALQEKPSIDLSASNGPASIRTKAQIVEFLKNSFALGHRAAKSLTTANMLDQLPFGGGKAARLFLVTYPVGHAFDHYGQMVEYLRMNGIVPPASR
ncbi:MAG: DinB family protein [Candidatus Acidiferrales bacterium]